MAASTSIDQLAGAARGPNGNGGNGANNTGANGSAAGTPTAGGGAPIA